MIVRSSEIKKNKVIYPYFDEKNSLSHHYNKLWKINNVRLTILEKEATVYDPTDKTRKVIKKQKCLVKSLKMKNVTY